MNRPRHSEDQIIDLLRKVQHRLGEGKSLASVCKSLGISQSTYRRWRIRYGKRAKEHAAAVARGSSERGKGARPISTENLVTNAVEASPSGKVRKLSEEAKELLDAANDASSPARNAWLVFLAILAYLLLTLGGVSHKDLLLNTPVKLPIIVLDIPLFSFFQYAPVLLLLVYLYLVIQHVMLARKYRKFADEIVAYEKEAQTKHPARELVHPYVVSQILAGPERNLVIRWLMRLMVFVTFALLPIVTLLYFQVTFLPYHEVWITYWHRIAVLIGLAMLFIVLPIMHLRPRKREVKVGPQGDPWRASPLGILIGIVLAAVVLGFSWLIATVPNEGVDRLIGFVPPDRAYSDEKLLNPLVRVTYERVPQAYKPEDLRESWILRWLLSYRVLIVEDTDLVPDEGDTHGEVSVVLRERDLQFAWLNRSDLHRADLTKADLRGARIWQARLEKAKLEETRLQGADLRSAELQGADLRSAELQGANLLSVKLQGADLKDAQLQGAYLWNAELQGANLVSAKLQGADLSYAKLQGAHLYEAELQGADLRSAELQGADLALAQLQGADLRSAKLQGANLEDAKLQGAHLYEAELQGAYLWSAKLQGTNLLGAKLQGADLEDMRVWLARFPGDYANRSPVPVGLVHLDLSPPTAEARAELKQQLKANITDRELLKRLIERLDPILRDDPPKWEHKVSWIQYVREARAPSPDQLVPFLAGMACGEPGGYIANSMAKRAGSYSSGYPEDRTQYAKPLAKALLNENCKGAKALTDSRRAGLQELVSPTE